MKKETATRPIACNLAPYSVAFAVLLAALVQASTAAAVDVRTVALFGNVAPGTSYNYSFFGAPILNNFNQVAFVAEVEDDQFNTLNGLWSEGSGALSKVALQGESAPGTALSFESIGGGRIYLNNTGQTGFQAILNDSTEGVFSETGLGNALRKVAAGGDPAPGTNDPARVFQPFFGTLGGFNDNGQSTFKGSMPPTASPPGNFPSNGVWSEGSGVLDKIAEFGDGAPDTVAVFNSFGIPAINDNGAISMTAGITSGGTGEGIWTNRSGSLARLAGNGDAAPGGGTFSILFSDTTAINTNGDIVFSANLVGGTVPDGVWVARGGGIDKVAVEGDLAPGGGGATFRASGGTGIEPSFLGLDENGGAAFTSYLSDGRRGLFTEGFGALDAVAISGDLAPDSGGSSFLNVLRWTINGNGEAAFLAQLSDFTSAIFAQDTIGILRRVVGEGDLLEVANGDFREIEFLSFHGLDGSSSASASGFGDDGHLAFRAEFLDGTSGVFVTMVVPEPSTMVLMLLGFVGLRWRLRRRK